MKAPHTPDPGPIRHRRRLPYVVGAVVVAGSVAAATVLVSSTSGSGTSLGGAPAAAVESGPAPLPVITARTTRSDRLVPWDAPLALVVTGGAITAVTGTDPVGDPVSGSVGPDGAWTSAATLLPAAPYVLTATVTDADGAPRTVPVTVRTAPATALVKAALSPGDDRVVGIGQPVSVRLDRDVESAADRKAVESRLSVSTVPAQPGAWRWMSDREVHYRAATFWTPGTTVAVKADLARLPLSGGVWGTGSRTTRFAVGDAVTSVVDVKAKTMTVSRAGKVLRTMKASMGRTGFDTRGGTFLVLEKFEDKVMDGSTLAVPADYSTAVKHAVRISNSGTFAHGAPWSVKDQGVRNVSHGCINLSPADAKWFFGLADRGDVVKVVNAVVGPLSYDAGSQDWNMSFAEWKSDSDGA